MRTVRFLKHFSPYNSGEAAGFDDATAAGLVRLVVAEYADGAPASEAAPKADTTTLPPSTSETGAASTLATSGQTSEERKPDPAQERRDALSDSVSRPQREQNHRRNRR